MSNPKVMTCKNLYKYGILINIAILIMTYKDYILYLIYLKKKKTTHDTVCTL